MNFTIATNSAEAAKLLRQEIRAFQRQKRVEMRRAANLVKDAVAAKLLSGTPLRVSGRKQRGGKGKKRIGPLSRSIRIKVIERDLDVTGFIRPAMRGFYGRFHERGLDATAETRTVKDKRSGRSAREVRRSHRFHLPARPYLEPSARAKRAQVIAILGDSFKVFQGGLIIGGEGA